MDTKKDEAPTVTSSAHNSKLDAVVDVWFRELIPNSPASATVAAWNHLIAAKEELKRRLAKETA